MSANPTNSASQATSSSAGETLQNGYNLFQKWERTTQLLLGLEPSDYEIGLTPKDEVFRCDSMTLYRYRPVVEKLHPTPMLIVYAMFGRYTMIDLEEELSMVRKLLAQGMDVYVIDWGQPKRSQRWLGTDDYVNGYLADCVDVVLERSGVDSLNLLGICQGGMFSLCYTALQQRKVKTLTLIVTPIDLHADIGSEKAGAGYLNIWTRASSDADLSALSDAWGMIPASVTATTFGMMNPIEHLMKYFNGLLPVADDAQKLKGFLRMERWMADRPPFPGVLMREFLCDLYKHNRLVKNEIMLGTRRVDLRTIEVPILNIYAAGDSIIPPACSRGLRGRTGSRDYTELEMPGGHIGVFVGSRSQKTLVPSVVEWLRARS